MGDDEYNRHIFACMECASEPNLGKMTRTEINEKYYRKKRSEFLEGATVGTTSTAATTKSDWVPEFFLPKFTVTVLGSTLPMQKIQRLTGTETLWAAMGGRDFKWDYEKTPIGSIFKLLAVRFYISGSIYWIEKDVIFRMMEFDDRQKNNPPELKMARQKEKERKKWTKFTLLVEGDGDVSRTRDGDVSRTTSTFENNKFVNKVNLEQLFQHKVLDSEKYGLKFEEIEGRGASFGTMGTHAFVRRYTAKYGTRVFFGYCLYFSLELLSELVWITKPELSGTPRTVSE